MQPSRKGGQQRSRVPVWPPAAPRATRQRHRAVNSRRDHGTLPTRSTGEKVPCGTRHAASRVLWVLAALPRRPCPTPFRTGACGGRVRRVRSRHGGKVQGRDRFAPHASRVANVAPRVAPAGESRVRTSCRHSHSAPHTCKQTGLRLARADQPRECGSWVTDTPERAATESKRKPAVGRHSFPGRDFHTLWRWLPTTARRPAKLYPQ